MNMPNSRVVPTLTEVLDETEWTVDERRSERRDAVPDLADVFGSDVALVDGLNGALESALPVLDEIPAAPLMPAISGPILPDAVLRDALEVALENLLREELPSALMEVLIRMGPEISEALHEALKPSAARLLAEALAERASQSQDHS